VPFPSTNTEGPDTQHWGSLYIGSSQSVSARRELGVADTKSARELDAMIVEMCMFVLERCLFSVDGECCGVRWFLESGLEVDTDAR
jgi:hypothetical protein